MYGKWLVFISRTSLQKIGHLMSLVCMPFHLYCMPFHLYCRWDLDNESLLLLIVLFSLVDAQQKILQSDKDVVRNHILMFVTQVPPLLRYSSFSLAAQCFCRKFLYVLTHVVFLGYNLVNA